MFKANKYIVILKCIKHDFPAFMLFSQTNFQTSEGTFCRVEVHLSFSNGFVCSKIYDKRDDFDFDIVN